MLNSEERERGKMKKRFDRIGIKGAWRVRIFLLLLFFGQTSLTANPTVYEGRKFICSSEKLLSLSTNYFQPMKRGTLLGYWGVEYLNNWEAPLSGFHGNLRRLGSLHFQFYFSRTVSLQVKGVITQHLRMDDPLLDLNSNQRLQQTSDVGDFTITTLGQIISPGKYRPAIGLRVSTKLPNTNQNLGLGNNTTDVIMAVVMSKRYGSTRFFFDSGVGILTPPRRLNVQNDVFVYGFGMIWNAAPALRVAGEINGFMSSSEHPPAGTEDRSRIKLGVAWNFSRVAVEVFTTHGLTSRDENFGIQLGLSTQLNFIH